MVSLTWLARVLLALKCKAACLAVLPPSQLTFTSSVKLCHSVRAGERLSQNQHLCSSFFWPGHSIQTLTYLGPGRCPGVWVLDGDAALQGDFGLAHLELELVNGVMKIPGHFLQQIEVVFPINGWV